MINDDHMDLREWMKRWEKNNEPYAEAACDDCM
jgi:hypothetical protein